jgi:hypothetical protein
MVRRGGAGKGGVLNTAPRLHYPREIIPFYLGWVGTDAAGKSKITFINKMKLYMSSA